MTGSVPAPSPSQPVRRSSLHEVGRPTTASQHRKGVLDRLDRLGADECHARAEDELLQRPVAVKEVVIPLGMPAKEADRLEREVTAFLSQIRAA